MGKLKPSNIQTLKHPNFQTLKKTLTEEQLFLSSRWGAAAAGGDGIQNKRSCFVYQFAHPVIWNMATSILSVDQVVAAQATNTPRQHG